MELLFIVFSTVPGTRLIKLTRGNKVNDTYAHDNHSMKVIDFRSFRVSTNTDCIDFDFTSLAHERNETSQVG